MLSFRNGCRELRNCDENYFARNFKKTICVLSSPQSINVRTKGKVYERKIAKLFDKTFGFKFVRTPNSGGLYLKGDIMPEDRTIDFPFVVECKNHRKLALGSWERQLLGDMERTSKLGVLIFHRFNTSEDYAYLPAFYYSLSSETISYNVKTFYDELSTGKIFRYKEGYISTVQKILLAMKYFYEKRDDYGYFTTKATKKD